MRRMGMDEETRVRFERERQERLKEQIERRADPSLQRKQKLDTQPPSRLSANQIDERIREAISEHYEEFLFPLLVETIAHERDRGDSELQIAFKKLEAEVAKFEAEIAQLRAIFFNEKAEKAEKAAAPVDLPRLPLRPRELN